MSRRKSTASAAPKAAATPSAPQVRKAYSYLRFSTPDQQKGDSTRRQIQKAEEYVRAQEGRLVMDTELTLHDLGVSAFRGKNVTSGALADFRDAVRAGLVPQGSVLLVESLDRVSRQAALLSVNALAEICALGVSVVTLSDRKEYTSEGLLNDPMALMMAVLTFIRSNEESVTKSIRVKAAWGAKRVRAADGTGTTRMTSMLPAWLTTEGKDAPIKKIPEAAKVVKRIFRMYAEGKGVVAIQRTLNTEGVPTTPGPNGKKAAMWHASYLNRILRNPAVIGTFQPTTTSFDGRKKLRSNAGEPIKGYYPAVVDEDLFKRVQAMLGDTNAPGRGKAAQAELQNILGGLAVCSKCGASMRRKTMTGKLARGAKKLYAYFCCTKAMAGDGCVYGSTSYETVEAAFLEQAPAVFAITPSGDEGLEAQLSATEEAVSDVEAHRVGLRDLLLRDPGSRSKAVDLQAAEAELEELKTTRDALLAKRDVTAGPVLDSRLGDLRAALSADVLDKAKVNALLRSVLSQVVVDAEAKVAQLVWKHGGTSEVIFGVPAEN